MSVNGIFRQLTLMASPKSFSLIDLPSLSARNYPARMAASTDLPAPPAATKEIACSQVSSFACRFRFL
jgi:hypothetical protein